MNAVILGYCAEVVSAFSESYTDLAVTSPPCVSLRVFSRSLKQLYVHCDNIIVKESLKVIDMGKVAE